jgi:hypothetical protein
MPNLGELASQVISWAVNAAGDSSMRLGSAPTLVTLLVPLVVLSLVARPARRWTGRDGGALANLSRAMALAAESGKDAVVSIGSAGLIRGASAAERLQTLVALPLLGHLARAAARAGVPLHVRSNDPLATFLAQRTLDDAHELTATLERSGSSTVEYIGEGRPMAAAAALADPGGHGVVLVAGGMAEESLLLLRGLTAAAAWSVGATASPAQLAGPLLENDGAVVGPELFQAIAEIAPKGHSRTAMTAANRLIIGAIVALLLGSAAMLAGAPDLAPFLAGR